MSIKRLLVATSVLALGLGGAAFAQTGMGSSSGAMGKSSPSYSAPSNSSDQGSSGSTINGAGANSGPMATNSSSAWTKTSGMRASSGQIKQAQEALQTQGLYHGQLDGKMGPQTRNAVAQFQKEKGLKQTAQLDPQTMNDLQSGAMGGSDNMSSMPGGSGASTPGNGPATESTNPGGQNNGSEMPAH
jgi:peptidoglycan hydrolase-like protein with peptidoglycan-binding domain